MDAYPDADTTATLPGTSPDAVLFISSDCPHCPTVLQGLSELVKTGRIGRLEVVNITAHPEAAQAQNVRAVPWLRLGPFELTGLRAPAELAQWAARAQSSAGMADYFRVLLAEGNLAGVGATLQRAPGTAAALVQLLGDPEAELQIRLGVSALLEDLEGSATLSRLVDALGVLTRHDDPRIRMDACHALYLSHNLAASAFLEALRNDPDPEVREVAEESLAGL